jgi:cell division protein FtsB
MITKRPRNEPRSHTGQGPNRKGRPGPSWGVPFLKCLVSVLVALNVLLFYGILFSSRGVRGYRLQQSEVVRLAAVTQRLAQDNQRLVNRIRHLKSDPGAQERLVKQELGWVREDEIIVEFATPLPP